MIDDEHDRLLMKAFAEAAPVSADDAFARDVMARVRRVAKTEARTAVLRTVAVWTGLVAASWVAGPVLTRLSAMTESQATALAASPVGLAVALAIAVLALTDSLRLN